jgi:adenosine deaminase
MIFALAERNRVALKYPSIDVLRAAYQFKDLQSFLDLYYAGMAVLRTEQDFADLATAYFLRAREEGVVHAEIFFDPQAHTMRGVPYRTVIDGLWSVIGASRSRFGISSKLIMCFLRDQSAESAMATLEEALPFGERIVGVGLDSAERDHPPSKFETVFARARANGLKTVAHAGEEGPPEYVWQALQLLHVSRIDHGVRSIEDARLVAHLVEHRVPLTVCPFSNVRLRVVDKLSDHPLPKLIDAGLVCTINSDDPAYFGGYVGENYRGCAEALHLSPETLEQLARNSFTASFLTSEERAAYFKLLDDVVAASAGSTSP